MSSRTTYEGPALFSYGFRPFFLAAILFALTVVPVWLIVWRGSLTLAGPFSPVDWHIHEMIFGYAPAVVAGFLFTAVPNWTGRLPTRGWPLGALSALWLAGRMAVWGALPLGPVLVMAIDCAFLVALGAVICMEIVAGRNWRNLAVAVPVLILAAANAGFHLEAIQAGQTDIARRLGLSVLLFLVTLIGGRIIPSFTRNWLAQRRAERMPAPFGKFDRVCLLAGGVALLLWTGLPQSALTAAALALAAGLHLVRLARWRGPATWPSPLLLMLHVSYLFLPLGLATAAGAALGLAPAASGFHLLGIGAIGGMTVAVMMRATRGHTGRSLEAGSWLTLAFSLVAAAALTRAILPDVMILGQDGITVAAGLWTMGFAILCLRLAPWLLSPNVQRRTPNRRPAH